MCGEIRDLSDVPDDIFSTKIMGDGFMILPENGEVFSPVDGVVKNIFSTKHSIMIETKDKREILIHLGIDTVSLKGEGFEAFIDTGDIVDKGQLIAKMDLDFIKENNKSIAVPIIFTNLNEDEFIYFKTHKKVKACKENVVQIHKNK
ncbi:PTS system, glucose subfamily, IIA component [Clostridium cavendishii DSM 21758]|uniref:PTS system, glucose subfamily, IIA component n=1 Tax=Clostridium cavendishii DSM 21758 TaxID=1121302 RepID=A0A1M6UD20_9CLOT|nr:PTS system, glucose subfamily, IIA component [Clostridium cavendishii DSM 21758]